MISYYTEKLPVKRVYYTGTDTLQPGYALCYDRDNITAEARGPGFHLGSTVLAQGAALAAGYTSYARHTFVEKPASGNLKDFAGFVSDSDAGIVGPAWIDIIEPAALPRGNHVHTDVSTTANTTFLSLQAASYALGDTQDGPIVAKALQTRDRSSVAGLVQALIFWTGSLSSRTVTASSRTTVQLPTAAIWDNFPLEAMRANPFLGSLLDTDFRHGNGVPASSFVDATYAASAAGKTVTGGIYTGITAIGELILKAAGTNDNAAECQWDCPITASGGNEWGFECRIKGVNITTEKASWSVGLGAGQALAGDIQADAGAAPTDGSFIYFNTDAAATAALDTIYRSVGATQDEHAAAIHTLVANTYVTLGLYFNGTVIQQYVNGVAAGTNIVVDDIAHANFPTGLILVPTVALKAAHTDAYTLTMDWMRVAQAP